MATLLKHTLAACVAALAVASLCAAPASASTTETHPKAKVLKHKAKKAKKAEAPAAAKDEPEPDITDSATTEYHCELGNKVTIYTNEKDADHIALRWKNRLHRMSRVLTTTGAHRFENSVFGLIWIGIPAKAMLLDSKQNRQLANECKNAEQSKPPVATVLPAATQTDATRVGSQ